MGATRGALQTTWTDSDRGAGDASAETEEQVLDGEGGKTMYGTGKLSASQEDEGSKGCQKGEHWS